MEYFLIFASDIPGGFRWIDLYCVSELNDKGEWSQPRLNSGKE
jgi:hypothetical protein